MTFTRSTPSPASETVIMTVRCFSSGNNSMNISRYSFLLQFVGIPARTHLRLGRRQMQVGDQGCEVPVRGTTLFPWLGRAEDPATHPLPRPHEHPVRRQCLQLAVALAYTRPGPVFSQRNRSRPISSHCRSPGRGSWCPRLAPDVHQPRRPLVPLHHLQ